MKPKISLREFLSDPELGGHVMVGDTWRPQRILSIAAMGETLTEPERVTFKQFTGRDREPGRAVREFHTIGGRRTGKTVTKAMNATYLASCCDYSDVLIRGETGVCLCLAQDQRVATQLLNFVESNLNGSPILRQLIVSRTQDAIELSNNIRIEVRPASFRKLRGPTYIAIICDELAFWFTDEGYVNPDIEIIAAARPGLMTTHGPLLTASSPYAKRGVLWDTYKRHYGPNGTPAVLVAKGTTREFNPTIAQEEIDAELERDPIKNRAEYLAEFRSDIEGFVSIDAVQACVAPAVFERVKEHYVSCYAFVDPSGGSSDSMTLAIGHRDLTHKTVVVDALREIKPPFSPEAVVQEFALLCKSYSISKITGDRYAGIWPVEMFAKHGIIYEQSAKPKSDLYVDLLPLINSRRIELLDHAKLVNQLIGLERRTARGGRDLIDHAPGAHDDLANVVAGLASVCNRYGSYDVTYRAFDPDFRDEDLPPLPTPEPPTPPQCNGDWWKRDAARRAQQTSSSADERLRNYYNALDMAFKFR